MEQKVMAIYDREEDYAQQISAYLKKYKDFPWNIVLFTDEEALREYCQDQALDALVVSEGCFTEAFLKIPAQVTVLLNESGVIRYPGIRNVDKYQSADNVLKSLLQIYVDGEREYFPRLEGKTRTRFIGMYSPVRRCLQTPFAVTLGQLLAREAKTLYLNFEYCAGMPELMNRDHSNDLSTLLYFLKADEERFGLRLKTLVQKKGNLDYIPPAFMGQNLLYITLKEWMHLFQKIGESGEYEYVILDLSESMQGLYEILRTCHKVFMIVKDDAAARGKVDQYEQALCMGRYEDVRDKIRRCRLPLFQYLPSGIEQYTRGDLADYVQALIEEGI